MKKSNSTQTMRADEKTLNLFAEMMIEKIQSINGDWKKPWFSAGTLSWPKNLNGREYNGMNAMMLLMQCEKQGYQIPRFCTFDCVQRLNINAKKDALRVTIKKGEHSFPVMLTTFTCINKDTQERIKYSDYNLLSDGEKDKYYVFPKWQVFHVFNVDQTNLEQARPEMYAKFKAECTPKYDENRDLFSFAPVDDMITEQKWICPIKPTYGNDAYFSISKNEIVVPEKKQFKDGESFYSNLFHEMAHSTGHESQLNRIKPSKFGSKDYAREELVAELTAALVSLNYGISKNIKEDSAAYLKNWLQSLKEDATFIKSVLLDVKKASRLLIEQVDKCGVHAECAVA